MARVLCLHGLGGTGATMWPLVAHLGSHGHQVLAPTLPGHGSRPEDLLDVGWDDWLHAALEWPADIVVGQSMGGSLALAVAAAGACDGVVAINPVPPDLDALDALEWRRERGHEWIEDAPTFPGESAYTRLPIAALVEMTAGVLAIDLAAVDQPVLLVSSADDDVIDPASAATIAGALGGRTDRLTLDRGGHTATLGEGRMRLAAAVETFIATAGRPRHRRQRTAGDLTP